MAALDGGGGGGGGGGDSAGPAPGLGLSHARRFSRSSRHQSVEDELWGWFGDDRPPSDVGDIRYTGAGGASSDRLFSRVGSGFRVGGGGGRAAETGAGLGDAGDGTEMTVSVSTTALAERLAKLSAGRALLDQVRAESRALADLVSSAARRAFAGGGADDCEGRDAAPLPAAEASREEAAAAAAAATTDTASLVRRVSISVAPATILPAAPVVHKFSSSAAAAAGQPQGVALEGVAAEGGEQAGAIESQGSAPSESLPPNSRENNGHAGGGSGGGGRMEEGLEERQELRVEGAVEQVSPSVESIAQGPADGGYDACPGSGEDDTPAVRRSEKLGQESLMEAAAGDQEGGSGNISSAQQQQQQCGIRQGVVEARAELERLQREIRLLARQGEDARSRVSPLVARRAVLARAALPGARRMARRLQEVADTQRVRRP